LGLDDASQSRHVLVVLYNRQPFSVRMRFDPFESLQHLVAFDPKAAGIRMVLRNYGAPDRMSMQDSARSMHVDEEQVQRSFSRGLARSFDHGSARVDPHEILGR